MGEKWVLSEFLVFDGFYSFFSYNGNADVKFYGWSSMQSQKKIFSIFLMERPYLYP